MLNRPNLDDQRFEDIVEEAVRSIPYVYPRWTDHNAHDPGITLIELFAWYKEMQQYHLNTTPQRVMDMYLKLLGRHRRDIKAAQVDVTFAPPAHPLNVREGERVVCDAGMIYEFTKARSLGVNRIIALAVEEGRTRSNVTELILKDHLPIQVLKDKESRLFIGIDGQVGETLEVWFDIADPYPIKRTPFAPGQHPGREIAVEAGGQGVQILEDGTYALSQSGRMVFKMGSPKAQDPIGLGKGVWLTLRLIKPGCEEIPLLTGVSVDFARLEEKRTLVKAIDYTCGGQRIDLNADHPLMDDGQFILMGRDDHGYMPIDDVTHGDGQITAHAPFPLSADGQPNVRLILYEPWVGAFLTADGSGKSGFMWPVNLLGEGPNTPDLAIMALWDTPGGPRYRDWRYTPQMYTLGKMDRGFGYDAAQSSLTFGDNERGEVAPAGVESLILTGLSITLGGEGRFPEQQGIEVKGTHMMARSSRFMEGADRQSVAQARDELINQLALPAKAVTEADYAYFAKRTPGLRVAQAGAIAGYDPRYTNREHMAGAITVVVKPFSEEMLALPDEDFIEKVQAHLEGYRTIGSYVHVMAPLYIPIHIGVSVVSNLPVQALKDRLGEMAQHHFLGGEGEWKLGQPVTEGELIAAFGNIPEVLGIPQLTLSCANARTRRLPTGDIWIPPYALPCLGSIEVHPSGRQGGL